MASSLTTRTKTSDDQRNESNQKSEIVHKSHKVTTTSHSGNIKEKSVKQRCHHQVSASAAFQSSFLVSSARDHHHAGRSQISYARPFDEYAVGPSDSDVQSGTSTKPDGNSSSRFDGKS